MGHRIIDNIYANARIELPRIWGTSNGRIYAFKIARICGYDPHKCAIKGDCAYAAALSANAKSEWNLDAQSRKEIKTVWMWMAKNCLGAMLQRVVFGVEQSVLYPRHFPSLPHAKSRSLTFCVRNTCSNVLHLKVHLSWCFISPRDDWTKIMGHPVCKWRPATLGEYRRLGTAKG